MKTLFIAFIFLILIPENSFGGCCDGPWVSVPERPAPEGWCAIPEPYIHGNYLAAKLPLFFKGNLDTLLSQVYIQGPIDKIVYQTGLTLNVKIKWDKVYLNFLGADGYGYYSEVNNKVQMLVKRTAFPDEIYAIFDGGIIENIVFPLPEGIKSWGYPKVSEDGLSVLLYDLSPFPSGIYTFRARWHGTPWWGHWSDPIEIIKLSKSEKVKIVEGN